MRLIDADELRTYIDEYIGRRKLSEHERLYLEGFKQIIDNAPTVEAIPTELHEKIMDITTGELLECQSNLRPQGEWISGKDSCACYWFCSECKMSIPKDTDYQYHFCPWCGADMRGKEE